MLVTSQKFQSLYALVCKALARRNHRGTLPQSALAGCQLPQRGSREWVPTIQRAARKPEGCGRFSSPLRNSKVFYISPFIGGHSLSLAFARQLPQGGSRDWAVPFSVPPGNRKGGGRFSSPLRKRREFYISPFIGGLAKSEKGHLGEDGPWGGYFSRITGQVVFTALLM